MPRHLTISRYPFCALCMAALLAVLTPAAALADEFSDVQLKSFASAVLAINQIAEKWQPQIRAAESEDQAAAMLQQVDTEMRQAIETTEGIGIDDYQRIMAAAQADPDLKTQIDGLIKQMGTR